MHMILLYWVTTTYAFIVVKRIARGKLQCNWFTAAITAGLIGVSIAVMPYFSTLSSSAPKVENDALSLGFSVFRLFASFPIFSAIWISICSLFLPGFKVCPESISQQEYLRKKKRFTTSSPQLNKQLLELIEKPGKPSFRKYIKATLEVTALYYGVLFASGILGPFFAIIILFIISSGVTISRIPGRIHPSGYDPTRDIFNPSNPLNKYDGASPFYRYRRR